MNAPPADSLRAFWRDPVLWALVVAALAVRIAYNLALHPDWHPPISFVIDEREYFGAAHVLAEGRGFSFFDTALWVRPPLYVLFLGAIIRLWGASYIPLLVLQAAISAATLWPLGWLAYRVRGLRAARVSVLLALLYLPFTLFAGLYLSETLFLLLFALSLVCLVLAREALATGAKRIFAWPVLAGLLIGLATLTRATALGFVPLAALWLALGHRQQATTRRRVLAGAVLLLACGLVLVPWTARNYAAYGRLVAVDTTSGYNLWLGSVGVRDEERLQTDLRPLSGPVERQDFAYARAWENITTDPPGFISKGLKESLDLWRPLFSAEERQVRGYSLGRVPAWHLVSLFLFDDLLYVLILVAAVAGFALTPPHPLKWLTALWVLLWVVMSFVFFAVTRFRLPIVAALIPWAGVGILDFGFWILDLGLFRRNRNPRSKIQNPKSISLVASFVAIATILFVALPAIQLDLTWLGVERWGQQQPYRQAEALLRAGRPQEAIGQYRRANLGLADTRYGLAAALLQTGRTQDALAQLTNMVNEPPDRFEPFILRGEAARRSGDLQAARSFFNTRVVKLAGDGAQTGQQALDWAWDHLAPSPVPSIEIGGGLDIGYIRGFFSPETDDKGVTFRWSTDKAEVRGLTAAPQNVVKWSGWRPAGLPDARLALGRLGGNAAVWHVTLANDPGWATNTVPVDQAAGNAGQPGSLVIQVNPFVVGGSDQRLLGVRIASISASK